MIPSPFKSICTGRGYYVIAPALSAKAIGPFATRQEARAKATEWNRKFKGDGMRKIQREMMLKEAGG